MHRTHRFTTRPVVLACLALAAAPAFAADECKVEYGYNTTGNFGNRTDHVTSVELDVGQVLNVDRDRMNYVKNKNNSAKVKVELSGALLPTPNFTLTENQANPLPPSFYATQVKLESLECLPETPSQLVALMKAANKTATQIAQALKDTMQLGGQQVAEALKVAQYSAAQVAAALKSVFNASATQVAGWMKAAGYAGEQVAAALKSAFDATAAQAAAALKAAFAATGAQVAAWLEAAQYTAAQVAAALKASFNATVAQAAEWLKAAGYTGQQVAAALKSAFDATATQVATALKAAFDTTGAQVAGWLQAAGYTGAQIAAALNGAFAATAAQAAQWLKASVNGSAQQIAQWLRDAGYTLQQVAAGLESVDYEPGDVLKALKQVFNAGAEVLVAMIKQGTLLSGNCGAAGCTRDRVAQLLKEAGYQAAEVLAALRTQMQLGVREAQQIAGSLFRLAGTELERVLVAAGYTARQIAEAMGDGTRELAGAIGTGAAAVQRGADGVVAGAMQLTHATLGVGVRECNRFPSDRTYNPVPLPPGASNFRVTLLGNQALGTASAINDWPTGTSAAIEQRGPCFLVVRLNIPASAREGVSGQAVVMAGTQPGPRLNWRVGPVPSFPAAPAVLIGTPVTTRPASAPR